MQGEWKKIAGPFTDSRCTKKSRVQSVFQTTAIKDVEFTPVVSGNQIAINFSSDAQRADCKATAIYSGTVANGKTTATLECIGGVTKGTGQFCSDDSNVESATALATSGACK